MRGRELPDRPGTLPTARCAKVDGRALRQRLHTLGADNRDGRAHGARRPSG